MLATRDAEGKGAFEDDAPIPWRAARSTATVVPTDWPKETINWQAEFYGNAVYPSGGSSWTMRMQIAFLFPKLTPEQKKLMMEEQLKKLEEQQKAPEKK